jgi:DUF1680 family protein
MRHIGPPWSGAERGGIVPLRGGIRSSICPMSRPQPNRNTVWKPLLAALVLAASVPAVALLCRGRSPSCYDTANLPPWERSVIVTPIHLGKLTSDPVDTPAVKFLPHSVLAQIAGADEDRMFDYLEVSGGTHAHGLAAGEPGIWLQQAAVAIACDGDLRPKMDRVATRLMNAAGSDGYLGPPAPAHVYTAADIAAHARNLNGLLAYYSLSREPAVIYTAMRAGDFLIENYNPWPGHEESGAEEALVVALARLYESCGDQRYLRFAEREELKRGNDGPGLYALYEATGRRHYLTLAAAAMKRTGPWRMSEAGAAHRKAQVREKGTDGQG